MRTCIAKKILDKVSFLKHPNIHISRSKAEWMITRTIGLYLRRACYYITCKCSPMSNDWNSKDNVELCCICLYGYRFAEYHDEMQVCPKWHYKCIFQWTLSQMSPSVKLVEVVVKLALDWCLKICPGNCMLTYKNSLHILQPLYMEVNCAPNNMRTNCGWQPAN